MQRTFSGSLFDGGIEAMRPCIMGTRHMVSAANHAAAHVAFTVLENGGNAVDAGVAGGIALSVVQSDIVNFAGVAPAMVYRAATDEVLAVSGLGTWPRAVTPDFFGRHHGGRIPEGLLRCVVPAAPDAWITCLERFGTLSFADAAAPAIALARDGFPATQFFVDQVTQFQDKYRACPASAAIYLPDGQPPRVAHRFVQADLARTMQYMADQEAGAARRGRAAGLQAARDAFYKGDIMRAIVGYHAANGGLLAEADMAGFSVEVEPALAVHGRGMTLHACPPWCQGPVLLQAFNILADDRLEELGHNSADYVHLVAEALNLAFADRDALYTDPRFGAVPMQTLLSRPYAATRRSLIRPGRAFGRAPPSGIGPARDPAGTPGLAELGQRDTSYIAVVDRHGNAFSATPSDNSFEAPVVPGTGLCPSSRGSQSWADPTHPGSVVPRQAPAPDTQPGDGPDAGQRHHAVRQPRRRRPAAGDAAGPAERQRVRDDPPGSRGSAALRVSQLPGLVRAARLQPRCAAGRRAPGPGRARRPPVPRACRERVARIHLEGGRGLRRETEQGNGGPLGRGGPAAAVLRRRAMKPGGGLSAFRRSLLR